MTKFSNPQYSVEQLNKAIAIMKRAEARGSVCMVDWQRDESGEKLVSNEEDLHLCGNKACFAGHVAISSEFHRDGGHAGVWGAPEFKEVRGVSAVKIWLGIDSDTAQSLIHGDCSGDSDDAADHFSLYYEKLWADVTATDVIMKLEGLLAEAETLCDE